MADTRQEILKLGEKLIRKKGYHGFSYKDIAAPLGIKNAAIHYHFPSKAELGEAIIQDTITAFQRDVQNWQALPVRTQLGNFLKIYQDSARQELLCFMGALGPAYPGLPENMQRALSKASRMIHSWLSQVLEKGKAQGEFQFSETGVQKSDLILGALLSALILHRVMDQEILARLESCILNSL